MKSKVLGKGEGAREGGGENRDECGQNGSCACTEIFEMKSINLM